MLDNNKKKKVLIVGAGFAGLRFFYDLTEKLSADVEVTVIDERTTSLEKPSLPEVALDGKQVSLVQIELENIIRSRGARFVNKTLVEIKPGENTVVLSDGESMSYDYLVVATGAVKDYDAIPGYREFGYSVCDDVEAPKLWKALKSFKGGKIVIGSAKTDWSPETTDLRLAAPCEGPIGEILFMIDHYLREKNLRDKSSITVFSPGHIFFEDVGKNVHSKIEPLLAERDISVITDKVLKNIKADRVEFEDGTDLQSDFTIVIPPYTGTDVIKKSGIGDEFGFVRTDLEMRSMKFRNILVTGDSNANSMPKLGHIAIMQADVAFSSLVKEIKGAGYIKEFKPEIFCIMNRGGSDATLILSDVLYGGTTDVTLDGSIAHTMKWGFDSYYYYMRGLMPPEILQEPMERILKLVKEKGT
jgi:sulfide:quinone oxidoreductase